MPATDPRISPGVHPRPAGDASPANGADDVKPSEAFKEAASHLREAVDYVSYYVSAKVDSIKASVFKIGVLVVAGAALSLIGAGAVVAAGVLLANGLSGALAALWSGPRWTGDLAVGAIFLGSIVVGTLLLRAKILHAMRDGTVKRYEARREQQRRQYGHDVAERAQGKSR